MRRWRRNTSPCRSGRPVGAAERPRSRFAVLKRPPNGGRFFRASAFGRGAAVRVQDAARDVGRILAGQEEGGRRDFVPLAGPLPPRVPAPTLFPFWGGGGRGERRPE